MFCFQCEQTRSGVVRGCNDKGVCGKDEATADLQDLLIHQLKGIGQSRSRLAALARQEDEVDDFVLYALFTTLTNVNFDRTSFTVLIAEAAQKRDRLRDRYV